VEAAMAEVVRISVSLEGELLEDFDRFCAGEKYATRSEAIRQLLRERLTAAAVEADADDVTASLTLVYDHHRSQLLEKLLHLQHEHTERVVANLHVHLDHDHCMEVIVLRGHAGTLRRFAAELKGLKGIHQGQLVIAHADGHSDKHKHAHHHQHPHRHH
jgi:CopG family nickel-responsive transcriptional regulator